MLALPDLSIRQLEYLVAIAEQPTWADAAAHVGVTPLLFRRVWQN